MVKDGVEGLGCLRNGESGMAAAIPECSREYRTLLEAHIYN